LEIKLKAEARPRRGWVIAINQKWPGGPPNIDDSVFVCDLRPERIQTSEKQTIQVTLSKISAKLNSQLTLRRLLISLRCGALEIYERQPWSATKCCIPEKIIK